MSPNCHTCINASEHKCLHDLFHHPIKERTNNKKGTTKKNAKLQYRKDQMLIKIKEYIKPVKHQFKKHIKYENMNKSKIHLKPWFDLRTSPAMLGMQPLRKCFSHPSLDMYSFATPPIKPKLRQQIGGGLLIANHLNQSLWWANQKHWVAVRSYLLHSFLQVHSAVAPFTSWQPPQLCWAKTIFLSQTGIC